MIYSDALQATANTTTATVLLEESIAVCEAVLVNSASSLVTIKVYHSVGGREFRQIGTLTLSSSATSTDLHTDAWPSGHYRATVTGLDTGASVFISFSGD